MKSSFELQIHLKNGCNRVYAFFVKFRMRRHIRLHRRHSKNPNNLHKNSPFSKRNVISNRYGNRDGKLQMMLQKTISFFNQA